MINTDVGQHCNYKYCKQQDFLPFNCSLCKHVFCLDHRTPVSHECSLEKISNKAIVCPLCNEAIKYQSNQSEDQVWDYHYMNDCKQERKTKQKCNAQDCKSTINELNRHQCKHCNQIVCLKHRFPEKHNCNYNWSKADIYPIKQATTQPVKTVAAPVAAPKQPQPQANTGNNPEVCEVCGQKFPYIMQLIRHSEIHQR